MKPVTRVPSNFYLSKLCDNESITSNYLYPYFSAKSGKNYSNTVLTLNDLTMGAILGSYSKNCVKLIELSIRTNSYKYLLIKFSSITI